MQLELKTRTSDFNVEAIDNGFIVCISGKSLDDEWVTQKLFFADLVKVFDVMGHYFLLKAD